MVFRFAQISFLLFCLAITPFAQAAPQEGEARLDGMVKVNSEGRHNAFTDLIHWKGRYYVCFRHADNHMSMDGEIHVYRSEDMKNWEPSGVISTLGDDRDPHFAATEERLHLFFGTWDLRHSNDHRTPDRSSVRSHTASTDDGVEWSEVRALYYPGWWLWRVRYLDGWFYTGAYTSVRPSPKGRETQLLRSRDTLNWEFVGTVTNKYGAGESDMWLEEDGTMSLISRTEGNAVLFRSDKSFTKWSETPLSGMIHAPVVVHWKDRVFVAGRGKGEEGAVTRIWELVGNDVVERLTLPSGGDTSYAGLLVDPTSLEGGKAPGLFITWYSQADAETGEKRDSHSADVYAGRITLP